MNTKLCHRCEKTLPLDHFYPNKAQADGLGTACKECQKARNREYRQRHAARLYEKEVAAKLAIKLEVFSHYSPEVKCQRCGFSDLRALSLDHINGDGAEQRRSNSASGTQYYRWVRDNGYPADLQVLCMNCQWIKRHENHEHNGGKTNSRE
jgi:hypothetical protein